MGSRRSWAILGLVGTAVLALSVWPAGAAPTAEFGGHSYERVEAGGPISWPDAKAAAEGLSHNGFPGHLVVIADGAEDAFLIAEFDVFTVGNDVSGTGLFNWGPWIGLRTDTGWVDGSPVVYTNYVAGEPSGDGPGVHYFRNNFDFSAALKPEGWNDEDDRFVHSYLVEYPTPLAQQVPAPATLLVLALGAAAFAAGVRRTRR